MASFTRLRLAAAWTLSGCVLACLLVGCGGGGGGGGGGSVNFGRTYLYSNGGQVFAMTVDPTGRFTIFEQESASNSTINGAQGTMAANGQFFAQSPDATLQFTGNTTNNSASLTGVVQRNGQTVFSFTALAVTITGVATDAIAGTYFGTSGSNAAYMTVDPTGHGTLLAKINGNLGGAMVTVAADGTFTSQDNSTTGQLIPSGGTFSIRIDKLNGVTVTQTITVTRSSRAKWTFMVFINGANNLQEFGPLNVNQMEQVGSTSAVNMVIQWKQAACATCGSPSWTGTRRYLVTKDNDTTNIGSQLIEDMGQGVDMGDWRTLRTFVTWAQTRYPADHYALVIWNHGAGWRPTRAGNRLQVPFPRSVSIDDSTNHEIQTWEIPQALNVTPQLDMLIFDASLMQMTEVAYEVRGSLKGQNGENGIVVGSEESPPGEGYVYNTFLADLVATPTMTAAQFGTQIVHRTLEAYGTDDNLTQSCIDLSHMDDVASKVDLFARSLMIHIGDSATAMTNARNNAQHYAYPENKDLWDYAEIIKTGTSANDLKTAATNVQTAITSSVIAEQHGTINGNSHGLAIYVPAPISYLPQYANLALARSTQWDEWLQAQP